MATSPHTFRTDAKAGVFYEMICGACGQRSAITAREMVARGLGATLVAGILPGLRCSLRSCGKLGHISFTIQGRWIPTLGRKPAGWADSVEKRMQRRLEGRPAEHLIAT